MLDKSYSPSGIEGKWTAVWRDREAFKADASSRDEPFTIILPPPNITGSLTVGHALGTTVQDLLCRWKRLKGKNVLWLAGMDHAGIATQKVVERALEEQGLKREEMGREKFLEECWRWKDRYHDHIVEQLGRLGASLDWSRETFTLDPGVSRAVREVFVRLYGKGLLYRGSYIVNWCPSCTTAISDEEVVYTERLGKLYYIAYPFVDGSGEIIVGTTRPETMLGDVAVAMSPADKRAGEYEGRIVHLPLTGRTIPVVLDEAVDPAFGTGFLKVTPAHDATDFEIGRRHGLDPFVVIDREGRMNDAAGRFAGLDRNEARTRILEALEADGLLRKVEDYQHAVGRHDRCDTIIEPYVSKQWFLRMKPLAAPGIEAVERGEIIFTPDRWKGIYLSWMEGIRDWCVSRQLWWGHRIPVWYCSCGEEIVSVEEPASCPKCRGTKLAQDEDVLDTWFSSWLWTFSPMGWPERTKDLETFHPTNVLVTGGDIIFFWVARMIMASLEFMGEIPFRTVYLTGIVRDAKGRKMSKSLGNSPDPITIIDANGADALRFSLIMLSPPGQDMLFDEKRVEVGKHFANKIWNASRFVLGQEMDAERMCGTGRTVDTIASLFKATFGTAPADDCTFDWEDRWIVSRLARRSAEYETALDAFRFDEAAHVIYDFFWHEFCDWYLELSKGVFRQGGARGTGAIVTARTVLGASLGLLHPLMPFLTEEIWSMLAPGEPILEARKIPPMPASLADSALESEVDLFREIVQTIRNLRQSFNIPPSKTVCAIISCESGKELPAQLARYRDQIAVLAKVDGLEIAEGAAKPPGSAAAGLASIAVYMPLRELVDVDAERRRLGKEAERLARECGKLEARLADTRFLERAPAEIVDEERNRFAEMSERRQRIARILEDLE